MKLTPDCFVTDEGNSFCNSRQGSLKFFVNGELNEEYDKYVIQDLDRILISFGAEDEETIKKQLKAVTDEACIYSELCPERGTPPKESCVGGLGSGCEG